MSRKRSPLPVQVLLFLLVTMLGIATGNLNNSPGALAWGLEFVRRQSLPLAGVIVLLIIGVMAWQHRAEQRSALPARPVWDSDRSPFPGLEAFTEHDSAVFFGRDAEITELMDRLHPVVPGQTNRLIAVVGPSGAGKSSLVQAGVVPRLRQRRSGWIVVPSVMPGDHPLRSFTRSLAAAQPGPPRTLPLLAYALQELCRTVRPGRVLSADAYQRMGGVTGALTRQADKVATELGGADGLVLSTLLKFVTIGENEPTRRRVPRSTLTEPPSAGPPQKVTWLMTSPS